MPDVVSDELFYLRQPNGAQRIVPHHMVHQLARLDLNSAATEEPRRQASCAGMAGKDRLAA